MTRLLHTSDWHLGRSFHREDLLGAQAAYVDHLIETVRSERVDCVLISGDLYDRALPPVDAVRLCNEALQRLVAERVRVVIISGNHDSAQRLGFAAGLMDAAGVHVRTDPETVGTPIMLGDLAIHGIPYLEPELLRGRWELAERGHTAALTEAMRRIRESGPPDRAVVLAHAFVTGGEASDSERDISVGGVADVPVGVFDGVGYTALGHLHGRRRMSDTVYYSGSPLAYSFSEEHQVKGGWLVDMDGSTNIEFVPAPVPRKIARIRGRIDDLLGADHWDGHRDHWLQITLTDTRRPVAAMERLRHRFPHTLALAFEPDSRPEERDRTWSERIRERTDPQIAADFVEAVRSDPATPAEQALLHQAFEAVRHAEAAK